MITRHQTTLGRVAIALVMLVVAITQLQISHTPDYLQDYAAAVAFWQGESVHSPTAEIADRFGIQHDFPILNGVRQPHPPAATLLTLPFALLSFEASRLAWCLFCVASILAAWQWRRLDPWACAASAPMWCVALVLGTHEPLLLLLIVGAILLLEDHPKLAGGLLGGAIAIKAYPAVLVVGLVYARKWSAVVAAAVVTLALFGGGEWLFGLGTTSEWLSHTAINVGAYVDGSQNLSLVKPVRQLVGDVSPSLIAAVLCGLWALPVVRRRRDERPLASLLPVALLVCPISWRHYAGLVDATETNRLERSCLAIAGTFSLLIGMKWLPSAPELVVGLPVTMLLLSLWARAAGLTERAAALSVGGLSEPDSGNQTAAIET